MSRRIVPDTSVLVAASFREPTSRAAERLVSAIETYRVKAFAWPGLGYEFLKIVALLRSGRDGRPVRDPEEIEAAVERFFDLELVLVSERAVAPDVWTLVRDRAISPPDAWTLATAIALDAELWLTHDHADGFVPAARAVHPEVFTLEADGARLP